LRAVLEMPEVKDRLQAMGNEVRGSSPDEMRSMVMSDIARWKKVIHDANIPQQ
jgi:tripartite-type tricarboxylate transporter receptor subunit TctC